NLRGSVRSTFEDVIDAEPFSPQDFRKQIFTIMRDAMDAMMRGEVDIALAEFDRAAELRHHLPPDDPLLAAFDEAVSSMNAIRGLIDPSFAGCGWVPHPPPGAPPTIEDPLAELRTRAACTDLSPSQRAANLVELAFAEQAMAEPLQRPDLLDGSVEHLREAFAIAPDHDPERSFYSISLAGALLRRHKFNLANRRIVSLGSTGPAALEEAAAGLAPCREAPGGPGPGQWSRCCEVLAAVHRLAGRSRQSLEAGLDGLRGHTWAVLLQSGAAAATQAARDAAGDAIDLARAYLAENDPA